MNPQESTTFCSVPWTQLATNSSGYYRVCCNALPVKNLVRDEQGHVLTVYKNSAEEALNSPTYKQIRQEMLNSVRPEMCTRCFREEDSGVESARQRWNKRWPIKDVTSSDLVPKIQYVDLRLGNLCNLKCRMCNPYSSSKWVDEWNSVAESAELVPNAALTPEEAQRLKKMDWPENEKTWKNLEPVLNSVEEIYLTGGEPFLSLKQVDLLDWLIRTERSQHVVLKYNSNATLFPEKLISRWQKFKSVRLNLSIDGVGELNDYIRYPANWTHVETNLKAFIQLKKEGVPLEISVHTTVQNYNILELSQIILYFQKNYQLTPYLNILNHPACLNVRALPPNLKQEAQSNLAPLSQEKGVSEVISYMLAEDWSEKYWPEFLNYTEKLDFIR
ncbi:twitch domain-containing radical SAM protein, partial [bacterium]|nr:twitch domain-containing radical SAM protein [bacterium]